MVVTVDESSDDMVEYMFKVESQNVRDDWVKTIQLDITLFNTTRTARRILAWSPIPEVWEGTGNR